MNPPFKKLNNIPITANFAKKLMQKFGEYCYNSLTNSYYRIRIDVTYHQKTMSDMGGIYFEYWKKGTWVRYPVAFIDVYACIWYRAKEKKVKVKKPKVTKDIFFENTRKRFNEKLKQIMEDQFKPIITKIKHELIIDIDPKEIISINKHHGGGENINEIIITLNDTTTITVKSYDLRKDLTEIVKIENWL